MNNKKLAKIESLDEQMQKITMQRKQLVLEYKEQESKAKMRRITKRGAFIESILPETVSLTDAQVKTLLEALLISGYARSQLVKIAQDENEAAKPVSAKTVPAADDTDEDEE